MSEGIGKTLSLLICVVMISSVFIMDQSTNHQPEGNEFDESIGENENAYDIMEPANHGTRASVEGTMLDEAPPTYNISLGAGDYWSVGVRFEILQDCIVDRIGVYNGSYFDIYNIRLWTDSGSLLASGSKDVPNKTWGWLYPPPIILSAGSKYIVSVGIYGNEIASIDNPGPTADGVLEPLDWVYYPHSGAYPSNFYSSSKVPLVDIHYSSLYGSVYDITVPDDYGTIQEAIDAANPGESVFVRSNPLPYEEELVINKTIDLIGENDYTTIIDASSIVSGSGYTVHLTGELVNLSGFTIRGGDCGVFLDYSDNCTIFGNIITENNDYGIYMDNTHNDTISLNEIFSNNIDGDSEGYGILAQDSNAKGVWSNYIRYNKVGVKLINSWLWGCLNWNRIYDNDIGIDYDPEPLEIDGNMFLNNRIAIKISGDDSLVTISNNPIIGSEYGIYIETGSPLIDGNTFENNTYAIYYVNDSSPIILNNTFRNNIIDIYHIIWAQVDFNPNTLNLKSRGKWMTCYVELPGDLDVNEIDITTLRISKINDHPVDIPVESNPVAIEDYDGDGISELMVKFDRSEVQDAVGLGNNLLILTGQLTDGSELGGSDSIVVKNPP